MGLTGFDLMGLGCNSRSGRHTYLPKTTGDESDTLAIPAAFVNGEEVRASEVLAVA